MLTTASTYSKTMRAFCEGETRTVHFFVCIGGCGDTGSATWEASINCAGGGGIGVDDGRISPLSLPTNVVVNGDGGGGGGVFLPSSSVSISEWSRSSSDGVGDGGGGGSERLSHSSSTIVYFSRSCTASSIGCISIGCCLVSSPFSNVLVTLANMSA